MEANRKEDLIARFRAYLERDAETQDTDPAQPDLYTLLAELAALKNEVKLEARQVKTALDQFREVFETLRQTNDRLEQESVRLREREGLARQETERELLLEVLDIYDRLQAGRDQARRFVPSWLARRSGADAFIQSLADGQDLTLRRIEDILNRRGVYGLETRGQPFDPRTMQATGSGWDPELAEGVVIQETRRGFSRHNRLLRPAEVVVNKQAQDS